MMDKRLLIFPPPTDWGTKYTATHESILFDGNLETSGIILIYQGTEKTPTLKYVRKVEIHAEPDP